MRRFLFAGAMLVLVGLYCFLPTAPQLAAAKPEEAFVDTYDRVRLKGEFAPGKAKAPCVVLLPDLKGKRTDKGWKELIEALTKKEYAVLSFDFRGQGDSTTITKPETFWNVPANKNLVKYNKDAKDKIEKYDKNYKPQLVNDIAAMKHFLEERAAGNIGNIVIIGAQDGAALGALWLASEWFRKPTKKIQLGIGTEAWLPDNSSDVFEGEDVVCGIWLTIPDRFANHKVTNWLMSSKLIRQKVPMVFFCGEKDKEGLSDAEKMVKEIKRGAKKDELDYTVVRKKPTDAKGAQLLLKDGTIDDIINCIDKCMDRRQNADRKREIPPEPMAVQLRGLVSGW